MTHVAQATRAPTLLTASALPSVLVLFLAAYERLIGFDLAFQRTVKRLGLSGMAKAMQHEPCCLLRDANILGELE